MNKPLISVIIPVFNCKDTIRIAIDSIQKQSYENLEIIVVNDGSTDTTKDVVREMMENDKRIILIEAKPDNYKFDKRLNRNVNAGWSARNSGFEIAKGQYITFQDADDASLLNRIEIQYNLIKKYEAIHVTLDWFKFDEKYLNKTLDYSIFENKLEEIAIGPKELCKITNRSKGLIPKISKKINSIIPFYWKRKKIINKLFWGTLENYPGTGNSPLFKKEVIEKVQFRKLKDRIWPSFMGRGADRDFNFQVAETFKNSYVFFIPAYMWRVKDNNLRYNDNLEQYLK